MDKCLTKIYRDMLAVDLMGDPLAFRYVVLVIRVHGEFDSYYTKVKLLFVAEVPQLIQGQIQRRENGWISRVSVQCRDRAKISAFAAFIPDLENGSRNSGRERTVAARVLVN
jgi:hypothetical protein